MWDQIASNKRKSAALVVLVAMLLFALGYFLFEAYMPGSGLAGLLVAFLLWMILSAVSYYQGDGIFLALAGAHKVEHKDLPVLANVVTEMSIAAGLPKPPDIYVIDQRAPNAFATGRDPDHAAIAVTSGLLAMCSRDELQGVVAHELGHVRNRDTLLMLMAGIMVGCIALLANMGARSFRFGGSRRSSSRGGGGGQAIILLIAILLMILGPIVAQLVYLAISRRREYLADASAALYTRYPEGLASALEKISKASAAMESVPPTMAPMYIVNPLQQQGLKASDMSSTHPPISERIRILRSMAGASLADYDAAYRKTARGGAGLLGFTAPPAGSTPVRAPSPGQETAKARARGVGNFFWNLNNYLFLTCACGAVIKLPPGFVGPQVKCPLCASMHPVAAFKPQSPGKTPPVPPQA